MNHIDGIVGQRTESYKDVLNQWNPDKFDPEALTRLYQKAGARFLLMPLVMADFYNRTLKRRGEVNTFSIVKFRHPTNGTVNTAEHQFPDSIVTEQAWMREGPVGDWFYALGFIYDAGSVIRYIIESISRDGCAL